MQRNALEKQRASANAARTALDESGPAPVEGVSPRQQQQQLFEEQQRLANQDVDFQESLIIEREAEIRNIEQSVGELNELFQDVAHIVSEQGGQLDVISDNVYHVTTDAGGASRELRSADRYQMSARNKGCCLLIILAVVLVIIILAAALG